MNDFDRAAPPDLDGFEALTLAAYAALPEQFRILSANVVIGVAEEAPADVLAGFGIDDPLELTGLYEGVDILEEDAAPFALPNHVWLYRRAIVEEWRETPEITLRDLIMHVLVHEIGHHMGLSDDEMHAIEDAV